MFLPIIINFMSLIPFGYLLYKHYITLLPFFAIIQFIFSLFLTFKKSIHFSTFFAFSINLFILHKTLVLITHLSEILYFSKNPVDNVDNSVYKYLLPYFQRFLVWITFISQFCKTLRQHLHFHFICTSCTTQVFLLTHLPNFIARQQNGKITQKDCCKQLF